MAMAKDSMSKILFLFLLGSFSSASPLAAANDDPQRLRSSPLPRASDKKVHTLMCTTESCADADADTPGCMQYTTPLDACYNARTLFPGDESWSDLDIYDTLVMRNLKRTFYESTDGSCAGRDEGGGSAPQPVDGDDTFVLPFDACVGPFGPPRPWGKFTLLDDDHVEEEVLSEV